MVVRHAWAEGYGAKVDNEYLRLAPGKEHLLVTGTRDSLAQRTDDGSNEETVLDVGQAFGRTDWSGGEGYDWDPAESYQGLTERRMETSFWDSLNVDIGRPEAGEPYLLRLAKEAEEWGGTVTAPVDMAASSNYVYITDGHDIKRFPDWATTTPETTYTEPNATIVGLAAAPNNAVMAVDADGDVWYKSPTGTTFSEIYDSTSDGANAVAIWYVKARWVLFRFESGVGSLAEIPVGGGNLDSLVFDTMDAEVWSVASAGPAIVAAVGDGTLRSYTPDNADASSGQTLVPKGRIEVPTGETPYLIGANAGILGVLTYVNETGLSTNRARFYQAEVLDARFDYVVGALQLRREWAGCTVTPSYTATMPATRDELLFTIYEDGTDSLLWRFDIVTAGLSRYGELGSVDTELMLGSFDGNWAGLAATDVLIEAATYQSQGYLITPNITLGVNTQIAWLATVFSAEIALQSGSIAELYYSVTSSAITDPDHESWRRVRRIYSNQAGESIGEQALFDVKSRTIALQIKLYADAGRVNTPKISRTAVRGIPTHRDFIVQVPINVSDYIEVPYRQPIRVPGRGEAEHRRVFGLVGEHVELIVLHPYLQMNAIVDRLHDPVDYITPRGSPSKVAILEFRGSLITDSPITVVAPSGDQLMGMGLLGIGTMGIGVSDV